MCRWSSLRHEFGKFCQPDGEYILGRHLAPLLQEVRYGLSYNMEDLEAAYSELCIDEAGTEEEIMAHIQAARVDWFKFESWFQEHFAERDEAALEPTET